MAAAITAQLAGGITDEQRIISHALVAERSASGPMSGGSGTGDPRPALGFRRGAQLQLCAPFAAAAGQHLRAVPPGA